MSSHDHRHPTYMSTCAHTEVCKHTGMNTLNTPDVGRSIQYAKFYCPQGQLPKKANISEQTDLLYVV